MVNPKVYLKKLDDEKRDKIFTSSTSELMDMVKELTHYFTQAHVLVIVFSPSGYPLLFLGEFSDLTNIVERFVAGTTRDKERRRLATINTLKINSEKINYIIDVEGLSNQWKQRKSESMNEQLRELKETLISLENQKRAIENPKEISCMEKLKDVETKLQHSLEVVQKRKNELDAQKMAHIPARADPGASFTPESLNGDEYLAYANMQMMSTDQFEDALRNGHFALL